MTMGLAGVMVTCMGICMAVPGVTSPPPNGASFWKVAKVNTLSFLGFAAICIGSSMVITPIIIPFLR